MKRLRLPHLVMALAIGSMSACGGGGGAGSTAGNGAAGLVTSPLQAPSLSVVVQPIRTLSFSWTAHASTTRHELLEDIDGPNGPAAERVVATPAAAARSHTLEVFLPAQLDATYRLRACVGAHCMDSAPVGPVALNAGIGYVKSRHPAENDSFGAGLALSADGQLMAIGSPGEDGVGEGIDPAYDAPAPDAEVGAVQLYERVNGAWAATTYLKPGVARPPALFGATLSLSGQGRVLLVGAPGHTEPGGADRAGAAYVFRRGADGLWVQEALLQDTVPENAAQLGFQVALSGDGEWAAVSAPGGFAGGKVLLFHHGVGGWSLVTTWVSNAAAQDDSFGEALGFSADGRTLVVGAPREAVGLLSKAGAAYLYQRDDNGVWSGPTLLNSPDPSGWGAFGQSVTVSGNGNVVVIGEPLDVEQQFWDRRAHVYERAGAGLPWVRTATLSSNPELGLDAFGSQVLLSADSRTLAVGAVKDGHTGVGIQGFGNDNGNRFSGAVHLFRRLDGGAWSTPLTLQAPNSREGLQFGSSLALAQTPDGKPLLAVYGDDASNASGIGGDPSDDSLSGAGAVYLY